MPQRGDARDERIDLGPRRRARLGLDPGRLEHEHFVDAGQRLARPPPRRPAHQRQPRRARGERAQRRPGQQHVAVVVLPNREHVHAGPPSSRSHRFAEVARDDRCGIDLGLQRDRGRDQDRAGAGGARGVDVGADVADHHAVAGATPSARAASSIRPGAGLRQRQPSSGAWLQTSTGPSGPSSASTRALTASTLAGVMRPSADAALVGDHRGRDAGRAQRARARRARPASARRAPGRRCTARRRPACRRGRTAPPRGTRPGGGARAAVGQQRAQPRPGRAGGGRPPRTGSPAEVAEQAAHFVAACAGRARYGARRSGRLAPPRRRRAARPAAACARRTRASASAAVATVSACARYAPRGAAARARQPAPCSASISTSSALPACRRRLIFQSAGRTGWLVRRSPRTMRRPRATMRSARSASSRYARGKALVEAAHRQQVGAPVGAVGGDPLRRSPARRRCAPSRSAGDRPAAARSTRACEPATSGGRSRRSRRRSSSQVGLSSTSSSTNAIQSARDARQPMLRADAGPAERPASTVMRAARSASRPARSSGGAAVAAVVDQDDARRARARAARERIEQRPQRRATDGRDDDVDHGLKPRRRRRRSRARSSRARAGTARSPARRPAPSRSTPARRADRPPSAGRRC